MVVTLACVLAGVLGSTGATLAEPAPSGPAAVQPGLIHPAPFVPAVVHPDPGADRSTLGADPADTLSPLVSAVPAATGRHPSIATRHIPSRAEAAATGALHPATDRVMALLVGWVLLALVGGGLLAGPGRGTGVGQRSEPMSPTRIGPSQALG